MISTGPLLNLVGVTGVVGWVVVFIWWCAKGQSVWAFVVIVLGCMLLAVLTRAPLPVGLVALAFMALATMQLPSIERRRPEKPFENHPLELRLKNLEKAPSDARSNEEIEARVVPCPSCGRTLATTTRVCPRCETHLPPAPSADADAEGSD